MHTGMLQKSCTLSTNNMKSLRFTLFKAVLLSALALYSTQAAAQALNDYVSVGSGDWTDVATWGRVTVANPLTTVPATQYPGQNPNDGFGNWNVKDVYIRSGHTVTVDAAIPNLVDEVRVQPGALTAELNFDPAGSLTVDYRVFVQGSLSAAAGANAVLDIGDGTLLANAGAANLGDLQFTWPIGDPASGYGQVIFNIGTNGFLDIADDFIIEDDADRFVFTFNGCQDIYIGGDLIGTGGGSTPISAWDPGTSLITMDGTGDNDGIKWITSVNFYQLSITGDMDQDAGAGVTNGNIRFEGIVTTIAPSPIIGIDFTGSSNFDISFEGNGSAINYGAGTAGTPVNQDIYALGHPVVEGTFFDLRISGYGTKTLIENITVSDQVWINNDANFVGSSINAEPAVLAFANQNITLTSEGSISDIVFYAYGGTSGAGTTGNDNTIPVVTTTGGDLIFAGDGRLQSLYSQFEDNAGQLQVTVSSGAFAATLYNTVRIAELNINAGGRFLVNNPANGGGGLEIVTLNGPGIFSLRDGNGETNLSFFVGTNNLVNPASASRGTVEFYTTDPLTGDPVSFTGNYAPFGAGGPYVFYGLQTFGDGTITLPASNVDVRGNFYTYATTTYTGTPLYRLNNQLVGDIAVVQHIGGTGSLSLYSLTIDRASGDPALESQVQVEGVVQVDNTLSFPSNGWTILGASGYLRLNAIGTLTDGVGPDLVDAFGINRMLVSDGSATSGSRFGRYATSANALPTTTPNYLYPVGTDGAYSPVFLTEATNLNYTGDWVFEVKPVLIDPSTTVLTRQFYTYSTNITTSAASEVAFDFYYVATDEPGGGYPTGFEVRRYDGSAWRTVNGGSIDDPNSRFQVLSAAIPANESLVQRWGVYDAAGIPGVYYTHLNVAGGAGSTWSNNLTWTTDPSGGGFVGVDLAPGEHPGRSDAYPTGNGGDRVVILSGATVNMNVVNLVVGEVEIRAGGTLILESPSGNNLGVITGAGTLKLGDLPGVFPDASNPSDFVNRGTIEFFGPGDTLQVLPFGTEAAYNNLILSGNDAANTKIIASNLTVNGNLTLDSTVTVQVGAAGGGDIPNLTITVGGSLLITEDADPADAGNVVLTAVARRNLGWSADQQLAAHDLFIRGDLRNESTFGAIVQFTKKAAISQTWSDQGVIRPIFDNATADQDVYASAPIRFEQFKMDKGTDDTYKLTFESSITAYTNFAFVGHTDGNSTGGDPNWDLSEDQADLRAGTVVFGQGVQIELRSTVDDIDGDEAFVIDSDVKVELKSNAQVLVSDERILLYGSLVMDGNSNSSLFCSDGLVYRESGYFEINGGTFNSIQIRPTIALGHEGAYVQTGGLVNLGNGGTAGNYPRFSMPFPTQTFRMTGGTIRISNEDLPLGDGVDPYYLGLDIRVAEGNYEVRDGGTVEFYFQGLDVERGMLINSTVPFYDVLVTQANPAGGDGFDIGIGNVRRTVFVGGMPNYDPGVVASGDVQQPLRVLNDLTLGDGSFLQVLDEEADEIQVGRNLTIGNNANLVNGTVAPFGNTRIVFNGDQDGAYINNNVAAGTPRDTLTTIEIDKDLATATVTLSGAGLVAGDVALVVGDSLIVSNGILDYGDYHISALGTVLNDATIGASASSGRLVLDGTAAQTIAVSNGAVISEFGRLEIDNAAGVSLVGASIDTVTNLVMTDGVFFIGTHGLTVMNDIAGAPFSATKMIETAGNASDAGLQMFYTGAGTQSRTFPLGSNGADYLPATGNVAMAGTDGYVRIRPVLSELATMNNVAGLPPAGNTGEALTNYWAIDTTGFAGTETVDYVFVSNVNFVPGGATTADWTVGSVLNDYPFTREDLTPGVGGGYNAGTFTLTAPSHTLRAANYTAGYDDDAAAATPGKFIGVPKIFFPRVDFGEWNTTATWSSTDQVPGWTEANFNDVNPYGSWPQDGALPGESDIVYIGYRNEGAGNYECQTIFHENAGPINAAEIIFAEIPTLDLDGAPEWADRAFLQVRRNDLTQVVDVPRVRGSRGVFAIGIYDNGGTDRAPDLSGVDFGEFAQGSENIFLVQPISTNNAAPPTHTIPVNYPTVYPTLRTYSGAYEGAILTFTQDITTNYNLELDGGTRLVLNTGADGDFTINQDLILRTPATGWGALYPGDASGYSEAQLFFAASGTPRTVTVARDIIFEQSGANPDHGRIYVDTVSAPSLASPHLLTVGRNIEQNSTGSFSMRLARADYDPAAAVILEFNGDSNSTYTRVAGSSQPRFYQINVNKDTTTSRVSIETNFELRNTSSGATKALSLTQGKLILDPPTAGQSVVLSTGGEDFVIPDNAELRLTDNVNATITNGNASPGVEGSNLQLNGALRVLGNSTLIMVGDSTGITNNNTERSISCIVYGSSGNAELEIGGTAFVDVDGQFRRNTLSGTGAVVYRQTGGTAVFGRRIRSNSNNRLNQDGTQGIFSIEADPGSRFVLTGGGRLIVAHDRNGTSYPDLLLNTNSPIDSVTGGVLQLGYEWAKNTTQNVAEDALPNALNNLDGIRVQATQLLPQTEVEFIGTGTNTLRVMANDPEFAGTLNIGTGNILNTEGFTVLLNSDLRLDGTAAGVTSVTFQGSGDQDFVGDATSVTLAEVRIDKALASETVNVNLTGSPDITVTDKLTVASGNLNLTDDIELTGDSLIVAGVVNGAGKIVLNRTTVPSTSIGGGGELTNVEIRTNTNVESYGAMTVTGAMQFSGGRWIIGDQSLTLNAATTTLSDTSGTRYIELTPTLSTQGLSLVVPAGALDYDLPVGAPGRYTPVYLGGTVSNAGTYRVLVSEDEASAQTNLAQDTLLDYHWRISAQNGLLFTALTQYFGYDALDVEPVGFENVFYPGFIRDGDVSWTRGPQAFVLTTAGAPNVTGGLAQFNLAAPGDDISGTYTVGGWTELDVINIFYSRNAAPNVTTTGVDYGDNTAWSIDNVLQHTDPAFAPVPPDPNPGAAGAGRVQIADGHRVNITVNNNEAFSIDIAGPDGRLTITTIGNVLNDISGGGRLVFDPPAGSPNIPSGDYSQFINVDQGTVEFTSTAPGGETYSIPTSLGGSVSRYHGLRITGAGTRTFNGNTTIYGDLVLDGSVNPLYVDLDGNTLTVRGNITRIGTANITGNGTIVLEGGNNQVITGFEAGVDTLYNLTINKSGGTLTIGDDNVIIRNNLTFSTNFIWDPGVDKVVRFGPNATVTGINASRFIQGLVQRSVVAGAGADFIFPIGAAGSYRPMQMTSATLDGVYTARAFTGPPPNITALGSLPIGVQLVELAEFGYWSLSAPNGAAADVTVAYTSSLDPTPNPGYNQNNLKIAVNDSTAVGTWENFGGQGTAGPTVFAGLNLNGSIASSGEVTTISGVGDPVTFSSRLIAIGTAIQPFPIELLSFSGERDADVAYLEWVTASELNNERFEIERSMDGVSWETRGFVLGAGTTNDIQYYTFIDVEVPAANVYYRLKQVDFDGTYTHSDAIELLFDESTAGKVAAPWVVAPNPTAGYDFAIQLRSAQIDVLKDNHYVEVYSAQGQRIYAGRGLLNEVNAQVRAILGNAGAGNYLVYVFAKGRSSYLRFAKY